VCALLLVGASASRFRFYDDLLRRATKLLAEAAKVAPMKITEDGLDKSSAPPGHVSKLLVLSKLGRPLQVHYFQDRSLWIIEYLGEGGELVRRDIYHKQGIRVRQFYDQEGRLAAVNFLDEKGIIILRQTPSVAPPPPGWVY
jgi:hypothetical protein